MQTFSSKLHAITMNLESCCYKAALVFFGPGRYDGTRYPSTDPHQLLVQMLGAQNVSKI